MGFMVSRQSMKMKELLYNQTRGDGGHGVNDRIPGVFSK